MLRKGTTRRFLDWTMQDMAPERQADSEFLGAEDLLQLQVAGLEAAANPIVISRTDGTIIWVNGAFEQLSGYSKAEALGQNTRLLRSGEQPASFYKNMWDTILSGQKWRGELLNRRKDGSFYYEEMTITPVRDAVGKITHFIAVKLDITGRKHTEERLYNFAQVVENSSEMIAVGNPNGHVSFANQALLQAMGYDEVEILGKDFGAIFHSEQNPPDFEHEIRRRTLSGGGWSGECVGSRKDGSKFPAFLSTGLMRDKDGVVIGTFAIAQDITDRKHLAEQLAAAQKMEAVGLLAGGVAHDFNNILGVIIGYTDLLMAGFPAGSAQWQRLELIRNAGYRATALTQQLLAFSRKQVFQPKVLDLNSLVTSLNKMLRRLVREDIELVITLTPGIGNVKADPGQIDQVIMNLVVNARDAMPNGGKIVIETADADLDEFYCQNHPSVRPGRYVMMSVSDTGVGMDVETQARIFEPFFTTKEQGKGTGLGLATVYGIVKQSDGYIWVYSEVGKGTCFKVYLPRVDQPAETPGVTQPLAEVPRGTETVLLAEDEQDVREVAREFLESGGYTVLEAQHAEEALQLAARHNGNIALLITDMVMPGMRGQELAARLQRERNDLRVLYMSGYSEHSAADAPHLETPVRMLTKPFSRSLLLRTVRELLSESPNT